MIERWGKAQPGREAWHRLEFHCLDVAAVLAEAFEAAPDLLTNLAALLGLEPETARRLLLTVLAVHDVGKVAGAFQHLRPDVAEALGVSARGLKPYDRRGAGHDLMGFVLLRHLWRGGMAGLDPATRPERRQFNQVAPVLAAATGHHGVQPETTAPVLSDFTNWISPADIDAAAALVTAMAGVFQWSGPLPEEGLSKRASYVLNGLFTVCDWLGSTDAFAYRADPMEPADYFETIARPTAKRLLRNLGLAKLSRADVAPAAPFADLFAHLGPSLSPTPLQEACDRLFRPETLPEGPLLVILEDAPGAGKTEAGDLVIHRLMAGGKASGFYCGLPTTATADGAYGRKRPVVERMFETIPSFVLAHGRRHLNDGFRPVATRAAVEAGEGDAQAWFVHGGKRALLSAAGVGTVDQALLGALRTRHGPVRLWGLWRKALLVDEVHAYDDYMLGALKSLLHHQAARGESVILMSATLPSRIRAALVEAFGTGAGWPDVTARTEALDRRGFPLLGLHHGGASAEHALPLRRPGRAVRVEPVHDITEAVTQVTDWAEAGRCVVWFRNTVDDAMEAHARVGTLLHAAGLPEPILFHARFLPEDRAAIEGRVLRHFGKESGPEDRRGRVLIATQVAEQSLDLDADEFLSDLAPADAVLQRLGRRRRHVRDAGGARLTVAAEDARPDSPALLLMPPLSAAEGEARAGSGERSPWYGRLFPRAAGIYPDDARLWRGALHLTRPDTIPDRVAEGPWLVPEVDARPLLESVYAETDTLLAQVPDALHARHTATEGDHTAKRQMAGRNTLAFRDGLLKDWTEGALLAVSPDEDRLPTRLSDSYPVALAWRDGSGAGAPVLAAGAEAALDLSCISLPWRLDPAPEDAAAVEAMAATLPEPTRRRLRFVPVIVLSPDGSGGWTGTAAREGRAVTVRYDPARGLRVEARGR
ncbi:CRISPR-associated helicase Cas3' [Caenispirillum salinarum]|uniref:CRISPR-associated helicase Cas3' n=1 Tax=Caenispirillum salinarum TaxID=859058 RepID=UPI00384FD231